MRLKRMKVTGLFGLFNHEVPFDLERRITLIHAPNGFGKTVILKLISGFFGGSLSVFREYEYNEIILEFDNLTFVSITQVNLHPELNLGLQTTKNVSYSIKYYDGESEQSYNPDDARPKDSEQWTISLSALERYLPQLVRMDSNSWFDKRSRQRISTSDVLSLYGDSIPVLDP